MSMLQHNDLAKTSTKSVNKHQGLYMELANKELSRQLRTCTAAWMEWPGGEDKYAMYYADFSEMA